MRLKKKRFVFWARGNPEWLASFIRNGWIPLRSWKQILKTCRTFPRSPKIGATIIEVVE